MSDTKAHEIAREVYRVIFDDSIGNIISDNIKEAAKRVIEPALAEREAQVRAEEREKSKGLVDVLLLIKRGFSQGHLEDQTILLPISPDATSRESTTLCAILDKELATYNDNRKG